MKDKAWQFWFKGHKRTCDRVKHILTAFCNGPHVLDVGCGTGLCCWLLATGMNVRSVIGIDISSEMIKDAKRNIQSVASFHIMNKISLLVCSAECMPFDDNSFDCVLASEILEHVADVDKVVAEMYRVCKSRLVASVPNGGRIKGDHCRVFDAASFADLLVRHGWKIEKGYVLHNWLFVEANKI